MSRRTTLAVLATAAIVCGALAFRSGASSSGGRTPVAPRVPVFSLQRAPQLLSRLAGDARLALALDGALADPALGSGSQKCLVVRDDTGRIVYARNPSTALAPASNLKLLTAFAALERMGATTRYRTEAFAAGVAGGVVSGDLWVVGSGDPLLATADFAATAGYQMQPRPSTSLESLADHLVAAGVRQVQGRLMGDEGRYDTQRYVPTWKSAYITEGESGPASALTVNGGFNQWKTMTVPAAGPATHQVYELHGHL